MDNPADREKLRRAVLDLVAGRKMRKQKGQGERRANRQRVGNQIDTASILGSAFWNIALVANPAWIAAVQPWDSAKFWIFRSRSACDIPLLGQQRSRSPSKTTQNPRSLSCCAMCSARIFKALRPLFGFSCSFHFTNAGITCCIKFPSYGMRRLYANMASVNQFYHDVFTAYKLYCFQPAWSAIEEQGVKTANG
jgi:hypothetical protein